MISETASAQTVLSDLLREGDLAAALDRVEGALRRKPDMPGRLLRLDLLCLCEDWDRALRHTESCLRCDASCLPLMALIRVLIEGERQRAAVLAGEARPALPPDAPAWTALLLDALAAQADRTAAADALREAALAQAPASAGVALTVAGEQPFTLISDSDTRLGPVLELFVDGGLLWLPFCQVEEVEVAAPASLRDLLWLPAQVSYGGLRRHGFLPARYPGSGRAGDALALGRETRWEDVGATGVFGLGQKVLFTPSGDLSLYDLRGLRMTPEEGA